jgi:hypothetical protein
VDRTDACAAPLCTLNRREKGVLRRYVARMTGLSRAQVTRLIGGYADTGHVKAAPYRRNCSPMVAYVRPGYSGAANRISALYVADFQIIVVFKIRDITEY